MSSILIATLGSEPQVIPLAAHLLGAQGDPPDRIRVLHTDPNCSPVREALARLHAWYALEPTLPRLELWPIPIADVLSTDQLDAFGQEFYRALREPVSQGERVHLLLAGGRKSMTMMGMTIAQMLLGPDDSVWYIHSDEELRRSGRPLPHSQGSAQLVKIPLPRQSPAPPVYTRPFLAESPAAAHAQLDKVQQQRIRYFWLQELTQAERDAAELAADLHLTVAHIADRLHKSPKTITNQLNAVYSKMESFFGLQPQLRLKRAFLGYLLTQFRSDLP